MSQFPSNPVGAIESLLTDPVLTSDVPHWAGEVYLTFAPQLTELTQLSLGLIAASVPMADMTGLTGLTGLAGMSQPASLAAVPGPVAAPLISPAPVVSVAPGCHLRRGPSDRPGTGPAVLPGTRRRRRSAAGASATARRHRTGCLSLPCRSSGFRCGLSDDCSRRNQRAGRRA